MFTLYIMFVMSMAVRSAPDIGTVFQKLSPVSIMNKKQYAKSTQLFFANNNKFKS